MKRIIKFFKKAKFISKEWHLLELRADYAWARNIFGNGVTVCVVDDGVYYNPDIEIKQTKVNPITQDLNLILNDNAYCHGTSVAGIIAGKGLKYMVGIAPKSKLKAYNLLGTNNVLEKYPISNYILKKNNKIDIFNNSWTYMSTSPNFLDQIDLKIIDAIEKSAKYGRNGKGNIFIFSSGNGNLRGGLTTYILMNNIRYNITVGAMNNNLDNTTYSNIGVNLLCIAPAGNDMALYTTIVRTNKVMSFDQFGITTTLPNDKFLNEKGLIPYTHDFNGTSASCPMVSGCVALLLSYRPDLSWRDVKEIISRSCQQDYYINYIIPKSDFIFNGNKVLVSQRSGYGIINIKKLIKNAKNWKNLPKELNTSSEQNINIQLNSTNTTYTTFLNINENLIIETVQVYLTVNSKPPINTDEEQEIILNMSVNITSPMGTKLVLINNQEQFLSYYNFNPPEELQYYDNMPFLCELLRGEISKGIWTIEFKWNKNIFFPNKPKYINTLKKIKIDIFGH